MTSKADAGARLGRVVAQQRSQAGMTRADLARRAAVSMNTVMAIEQGRVADPGFFTVAALGSGLDLSLDELLRRVRRSTSSRGVTMTRGLVSIGYEGRALPDLISELLSQGVNVLADVRLNAISRRPGFSKRALAQALQEAGIEYRHFRGLGNPRDNRAGFQGAGDNSDRSRFRELLASGSAQEDLTELTELAGRAVVAVLCVERDEAHCHRQLVIEAVRERDIAVPALKTL